MTEQEREELIEKMALRMLSQDSGLKYVAKFLHEHKEWLDIARAALAVAEPVIREQCAKIAGAIAKDYRVHGGHFPQAEGAQQVAAALWEGGKDV